MADDWLGISSAELDDSCDSSSQTLQDALDGTDDWAHITTETHWFVLDLGQTYTIKKVRERSSGIFDPTDVNIYIDDSNPPTTLVHEGITTWQDVPDPYDWVEITLDVEGTGRYIKVEIEDTEHAGDWLAFGHPTAPFTIFDAYGDVAAAPPTGQFMTPNKYW